MNGSTAAQDQTSVFAGSADDLPAPPEGKTGWPWTGGELPWKSENIKTRGALPRVSVVTPSYNQAQYIEETIRSVLLQGYPNLEFVIIDGASTDGSVDVIRKYESFLTYWVSQPDRNPEEAINKGWERCTGDIVAFLCADDLYEPGAIWSAVQALGVNEDAAFTYSDCKLIDAGGEPIGQCKPPEPFDRSKLFREYCFYPATAFIRKPALDRVGLMNERLKYLSDWDLWLRLTAVARGSYVPRCLARARHWEGSKTTSRVLPYVPYERMVVLLSHMSKGVISKDEFPDARLALKKHFKSWQKAVDRDNWFSYSQLRLELRAFLTCPSEYLRFRLPDLLRSLRISR